MLLSSAGDEFEVAQAAASLMAKALPVSRLHRAESADCDKDNRCLFANNGWYGLTLSERLGGSELSAVDFALFFREVGRFVGPLDILSQSLAVLVADDAQVRAGLLSGSKSVALALEEPSTDHGMSGSYRLLGGGASPDLALRVNTEHADLVSLAGVAMKPLDSVAAAVSMRRAVLPERESCRRNAEIYRLGKIGVAAMLVGVAEASLKMIVDYAKIRKTFGRSIGAFQAVRHPCADMALRAEAARCQLWYATAALKERRTDADAHIDAAKHLANSASVLNSDWNIQLHGGIGVTDEYDAHLLLKHAITLSKLFGSNRAVLNRLLFATIDENEPVTSGLTCA